MLEEVASLGRQRKAILLLLGLLPSLSCVSQERNQRPPEERQSRGTLGTIIEPVQQVRVPGFEWSHEIQVALPEGYFNPANANRTYPVFWVTDGSWTFNLAVGTVAAFERAHVPNMIVVAIGVPLEEEDRWYQPHREYDFYPNRPRTSFGSGPVGRLDEIAASSLTESESSLAAAGTPVKYGGADKFLGFLIGELRTSLARKYRMMTGENTLYGYSGGGVFCTYALLTRPEGFNKYICGGGITYEVLDAEARYAQSHKDLKARVFLGISDGDILKFGASIEQLGPILSSRKYPSLQMKVDFFLGEDHMSAVPSVMSRGLRYVWEGSYLPVGNW